MEFRSAIVFAAAVGTFATVACHGAADAPDVASHDAAHAAEASVHDAASLPDASDAADAAPPDVANPLHDASVSDTAAPVDARVTDAASPDASTGPDPSRHHCAAMPSACGYPDATNSGMPAGTTLRRVPGDLTSGPGWHWDPRGWIQVDGDGAVLDGIENTAGITVAARNVTIQNCLLDLDTTGQTAADHSSCGIRVTGTGTVSANVVIRRCTIRGTGTGADRLEVGIQVQSNAAVGFQALGNDISRMSTGIQTNDGVLRDNYIHDFGMHDWGAPDGVDHLNGTTSNAGGTSLTVAHNTIFNGFGQTDAISLFEDFGAQMNAVVDNNFVAGGGYSIYGGANAGGAATHDIRITGNRIGVPIDPNGGSYGWLAAWNGPDSAVRNVESGNFWDDDGASADGDYTGHR